MTGLAARDLSDVSGRYRSALRVLTLKAQKGRKGEALGYLTATLYLMPHTSGGGKTLCPHSTEACRAMCLADAGLSALPRQIGAKQRRTDWFNRDAASLIEAIGNDISKLARIATREGLRPAVRLNGTSDILWEDVAPGLLRDHRDIQFYDYSKIPLEQRDLPPNYHLTFSVGGPEDMGRAIAYLRAGLSVAVVVPEDVQHGLSGLEMDIGGACASFVNGDEHDLRFLDAPGSIVLLKPKGYKRSALVRPDILSELRRAVKAYPVLQRRVVAA